MLQQTEVSQNFKQYLTDLITEKGVGVDAEIKRDGHIGLCWLNFIEFTEQLNPDMKNDIRKNLIIIDFKGGDVFRYLDHLVDGMLECM
jgi:hypothetical protein